MEVGKTVLDFKTWTKKPFKILHFKAKWNLKPSTRKAIFCRRFLFVTLPRFSYDQTSVKRQIYEIFSSLTDPNILDHNFETSAHNCYQLNEIKY